MASNVKRLKKVDVNLLRSRLKGQSAILSKLNNLPIQIDTENLLTNWQVLLFLGGVLISIIFAAIDLFLFVSNGALKIEYKNRLASIKPYNQKLQAENRELAILRNSYEKLNDTVSSFKDINNILTNYHSYYDSSAKLINFTLYNATKSYSYVKNIDFRTTGDMAPPSGFSLILNLESPSYNDDIWNSLKMNKGCYDVGIDGVCLNNIVVSKNLKLNKFGFSYFDTAINLSGSFNSDTQGGKKHVENAKNVK